MHSELSYSGRLLKRAVDMILPPRCMISGEIVEAQGMIAGHVWSDIDFIEAPFCAHCGVPFEYETGGATHCAPCLDSPPAFEMARAAVTYNDTSKKLILGFKHGDQMHAALCFTPWLMSAGAEMLARSDIIVPVPLHRLRLFRRRYNQAALLAMALSRESGVLFTLDSLKRQKNTASQGHMKPHEREKNVKGAFVVPDAQRSAIEGKSVLLVDDVYTTGATIQECAKVLKKAGAREVNVLTIARVVKGY